MSTHCWWNKHISSPSPWFAESLFCFDCFWLRSQHKDCSCFTFSDSLGHLDSVQSSNVVRAFSIPVFWISSLIGLFISSGTRGSIPGEPFSCGRWSFIGSFRRLVLEEPWFSSFTWGRSVIGGNFSCKRFTSDDESWSRLVFTPNSQAVMGHKLVYHFNV